MSTTFQSLLGAPEEDEEDFRMQLEQLCTSPTSLARQYSSLFSSDLNGGNGTSHHDLGSYASLGSPDFSRHLNACGLHDAAALLRSPQAPRLPPPPQLPQGAWHPEAALLRSSFPLAPAAHTNGRDALSIEQLLQDRSGSGEPQQQKQQQQQQWQQAYHQQQQQGSSLLAPSNNTHHGELPVPAGPGTPKQGWQHTLLPPPLPPQPHLSPPQPPAPAQQQQQQKWPPQQLPGEQAPQQQSLLLTAIKQVPPPTGPLPWTPVVAVAEQQQHQPPQQLQAGGAQPAPQARTYDLREHRRPPVLEHLQQHKRPKHPQLPPPAQQGQQEQPAPGVTVAAGLGPGGAASAATPEAPAPHTSLGEPRPPPAATAPAVAAVKGALAGPSPRAAQRGTTAGGITTGSVVWGKVARFPWWPAIIIAPGPDDEPPPPPAPAAAQGSGSSGGGSSSAKGAPLLVRFLGTYDTAWLEPGKVSPWGVQQGERSSKTKAGVFVAALKEGRAFAATGELPEAFGRTKGGAEQASSEQQATDDGDDDDVDDEEEEGQEEEEEEQEGEQQPRRHPQNQRQCQEAPSVTPSHSHAAHSSRAAGITRALPRAALAVADAAFPTAPTAPEPAAAAPPPAARPPPPPPSSSSRSAGSARAAATAAATSGTKPARHSTRLAAGQQAAAAAGRAGRVGKRSGAQQATSTRSGSKRLKVG